LNEKKRSPNLRYSKVPSEYNSVMVLSFPNILTFPYFRKWISEKVSRGPYLPQ